MMQTFAVTVERTLRRKLHIVAKTADEARIKGARCLAEGHRIVGAQPVNMETSITDVAPELGITALDSILDREWLAYGTKPHQRVIDWVRRARVSSPDHIAANKSLAMAGLRVKSMVAGDTGQECLLIMSPYTHPQIAEWTHGREFGGAMLLPALAALPGAWRAGLATIGGTTGRVVAVPMQAVLEGGEPK